MKVFVLNKVFLYDRIVHTIGVFSDKETAMKSINNDEDSSKEVYSIVICKNNKNKEFIGEAKDSELLYKILEFEVE